MPMLWPATARSLDERQLEAQAELLLRWRRALHVWHTHLPRPA
jgi:hypothetical protein